MRKDFFFKTIISLGCVMISFFFISCSNKSGNQSVSNDGYESSSQNNNGEASIDIKDEIRNSYLFAKENYEKSLNNIGENWCREHKSYSYEYYKDQLKANVDIVTEDMKQAFTLIHVFEGSSTNSIIFEYHVNSIVCDHSKACEVLKEYFKEPSKKEDIEKPSYVWKLDGDIEVMIMYDAPSSIITYEFPI